MMTVAGRSYALRDIMIFDHGMVESGPNKFNRPIRVFIFLGQIILNDDIG